MHLRKPFVVAFVIGFLITVPVTFLALLLPVFEDVAPVLTPGAALLRPLSSSMADWPGGINLLLGSIANGLVYAVVASAAVLLARVARR